MNRLIALFGLLIFQFGSIYAQVPQLEITPIKKKPNKAQPIVTLKELDIDVKIVGHIATTTTTMTFHNKYNRDLEGKLTFPLPEGVSVSGYALDINGKLRKAVPVEKEKATEVFESIERRRVDPGLIEKVEGNSYRTRIYPIPAHGTRTVQITYHSELSIKDNTLEYSLPMDHKKVIPQFRLKTTVYEQIQAPQLIEKPDGSFSFQKKGNVWTAEKSIQNYQPNNNLKISLPNPANSHKTILEAAEGNQYYFLSQIQLPVHTHKKVKPSKIAIVWDNSFSGKQRNHTKELEFLNAYFQHNRNLKVEVHLANIYFEKGRSFSVTNGNWAKLKDYLQKIKYDGGTDFSQLKAVKADEILFFSDGISSFGTTREAWKQPVYALVSSSKANYVQLQWICQQSGGQLINLTQELLSDAIKKVQNSPLRLLEIVGDPNISELTTTIGQNVNQTHSIAGILKGEQASLQLKFGYQNRVTMVKKITINTHKNVTTDWNIAQIWGQKKINNLLISNQDNSEEIRNIGKEFGIVTTNTSLIVLEDVNDYIKYKITPPKEMRAEYDRIMKKTKKATQEQRLSIMQDAENMIQQLKEWWLTDFKRIKKYPKRKESEYSTDARSFTSRQETSFESPPEEAEAGEPVLEAVATTRNAKRAFDDAITSKKSIDKNTTQKGTIKLAHLKSDKKYIHKLKNESSPVIYKQYLQLRPKYHSTPSFYFEIAQLLFQKGERNLGLKVLSTIADLDLENAELYKLLAYKLKEQQLHKKQLWITKQVLKWRPFDPQSYRDYALAAEDNGRYQEALDNLYKVLTQTYTEEVANRDDGIEEVILMEMNGLIARHSDVLNTSQLNPKLIEDLPVSIRVVLNWNKDNTDIDLWVTDPKKERCYYSNKLTQIGGRMSNDFTDGFGPEQFLLKKAVKGTYTIETNYFGDSQVSIAGPTALMAEVFINYGTGKQERKLVVFQNSKKEKGNKGSILIGTFDF